MWRSRCFGARWCRSAKPASSEWWPSSFRRISSPSPPISITSRAFPNGCQERQSFIEATGDQVYMRFHGKNRDNWFKRNVTAAERFKYLYSERELPSLAPALRNLAKRGATRAYAIFNNCYQNFGIMNATTMAAILRNREQE